MRCKDEFVVSLPWHCVEHVSRSSSTWNQVELTEIIPSNQCVVILMNLFLFHIETNVSRCRCRSIPICMVLSLQDPAFSLASWRACDVMLLGSMGACINRNRTDIFAVSLQISASRREERYGNSSTFVSMRPCPTQSIVNHKFVCQAATLAMHGRDAVEESADPFRVHILMMRPRETE